jgi:hypothetical protein
MSVEGHPNLHAVGFLTDIVAALEKRLRGGAAEDVPGTICLVIDDIKEFVNALDDKLDGHYGR